MSKKYIKQTDSTNFIYPNNTVAEYDVEIIHNINSNPPIGTVTSITITGATSTGMTLNWSGSWDLNGAEPFVQDNGNVTTVSIHGMGPTQQYFKPFRLLEEYTTTTGTTTVTYTNQTIALTPAQFGLSTFTNGTYNFEFRVVSKLAVLPVCGSVVVSTITPTPTPTPTPTGCTQTNVCMAITVTGATGPESYAGQIEYNNCDGELVGELFTTQGTRYRCVQTSGGLPQIFSYSGIETPTIYSGDCDLYECPGGVVPLPTPTPTPTPTPGPVEYDLYLADEYACTFPGCALQQIDVVVALPAGTTPQYGKFYPDNSLSGFVYLLTTTTSGGPGLILNLANFTSCSSACIV